MLTDAPQNYPGTTFSKDGDRASAFDEFVPPTTTMLTPGAQRHAAHPNQFASPYDRDDHCVAMDHCYARPWNWRPESTFLRPTKTLFVAKPQTNKRKSTNPLVAPYQDCDDVVDVEAEVEEPAPIYDKAKARAMMEECEKHAALARAEGDREDWEENVSKVNWTSTQNRLFNGMVGVLNGDRLARLAHTDSHHEPVARRITINRSVERVRRLMATVAWEPKYTQWLHHLLIDNLSEAYLAAYLDMLQTLKSKLPTFVDKMMSGSNSTRPSVLSYESLFPLLKRPWDPVASSLMQDKPKKLPGNPIIVVVPSTPIASRRMLKWITLLSNLATVVTIPANYGNAGHKMTMMNYVDQMFVMTRSKIQDIRSDYPGRNIVLVGFNFGATLALQLAHVEQVLCVVCLGFSHLTAEGRRGEPDDNLLELQCPVLFVVGQCSSASLQEDMEDLRERMRVETGLIVVGSADDNLCVAKKKKKAEGITQSVVDRCIADEVGEFISGIILSPYPPQIRQSPTNLTTDGSAAKKAKTERKRYNSNTSSVDSEPPSPTPRISRPGHNNSPPNFGRPPGSKSKSKLEAKWSAQGIPPSPTNSPPPPHTFSTPDTSSNDSFLTDKNSTTQEPINKKIRTLKPTATTLASPDKHSLISNTSSAKNQAISAKTLNFQNRSLASLLQSDIHTMVQSPMKPSTSGIRVLENVKLTSTPNTKFISNAGRTFDMSKISLINSAKPIGGNSIVLLPDGKIKNLNPVVKSSGRYITSKKQLIGNKPPKPMKKMSYVPQTCDLPPPTNLTTQDIMDLPIIFADDNQILENAQQSEVKAVPQIVTVTQPSKIISANAGSKFVLINKQISLQSNPNNFIIASAGGKKASPQAVTPKYTKIILSSKKATPVEEAKASTSSIITKISSLSPEISVRKITAPAETPAAAVTAPHQMELFDLEAEIAATTVYKSSSGLTVGTAEETVTTDAPVAEEIQDDISAKITELPEIRLEQISRRTADAARIKDDKTDGPPVKVAKMGDK